MKTRGETGAHRVREVDPTSSAEIELVATRMRETLIEVLGEERGGSMYTIEWLIERVRFHLDRAKSTGQVFVAEDGDGRITGHAIVRVERDPEGRDYGLFSTTFVEPGSRGQGVASLLLLRGERWMVENGVAASVTYTDEGNAKLIGLFRKHGYELVETILEKAMVKLQKSHLRLDLGER